MAARITTLWGKMKVAAMEVAQIASQPRFSTREFSDALQKTSKTEAPPCFECIRQQIERLGQPVTRALCNTCRKAPYAGTLYRQSPGR